MKESFGLLLKELREQAGLSLRQLEAATGISNGYLSQMESSKVGAPSPRILEKLAKALSYPYMELMKIAGHLSPDVPMEPVLRLREARPILEDLSESERAQVFEFIEQLKKKRIGAILE
jgi:transcriptional regulator with XRE-family HTH domain